MQPLSTPTSGWQARLHLGLAHSAGATRLVRNQHYGPLVVQRPFYPEGPTHPQLYILHPPGGLVGGDGLALDVELEAGASALLTTPSAGKAYRNHGQVARLQQRLQLASHAALEWLPQETILYQGTHVQLHTQFELARDAKLLAWDLLCLGRPAAGEGFAQGLCQQRLRLYRAGQLCYQEAADYQGGSALLHAPWGLGGRSIVATVLATPVTSEVRDSLRTALPTLQAQEQQGVTLLDQVLLYRYLGPDAGLARRRLQQVWAWLRPVVLGRAAQTPRIWAT